MRERERGETKRGYEGGRDDSREGGEGREGERGMRDEERV